MRRRQIRWRGAGGASVQPRSLRAGQQVDQSPPRFGDDQYTSKELHVLQGASDCGFDFVAAQLRRTPSGEAGYESLQPFTSANALLVPPGRSGQV